MKKMFLVKKDVNEPSSSDNWIVMNAYEFAEFIKTEDGKKRKHSFAPLDACSENEHAIWAECEGNIAKKMRKDKDNHRHLKKIEIERGINMVSYDAYFGSSADFSCEELIADVDCNVEEEVLANLEYDELHHAIELLKKSEQHLIYYLFLKPCPLSEKKYAKIIGLPQQTIHYQKKKALQLLKKYLEI